MTYRGVRLIFSLLVFFCCGSLAYGGPNTKTSIKMDIKMNNELPISKINIGSKQYSLMIGTWFSDVWLFSKSACEAKERKAMELKDDPVAHADSIMCRKVKKYDDTNILESDKKKPFEVPYIQGTLKGYVIKETIKIDGHDLQQSVGIVTDWPPKLATNNRNHLFDGYFGLMFMPKGKELEGSPFFKFLFENQIIASKQFGIYFDSAGKSGKLILGGINDGNIVGGKTSLKSVPVEPGGKGWLINIDSIRVGTTEVGSNLKAYVDTSTVAFLGKREIISKINSALGATNFNQQHKIDTVENKEELMYFVNCQPNNNIEMTINKEKYTLDLSAITLKTTGVCISAFQTEEFEDYDLIIGSHFLKKFYSVFDVENKKISFAEAKPNGLLSRFFGFLTSRGKGVYPKEGSQESKNTH